MPPKPSSLPSNSAMIDLRHSWSQSVLEILKRHVPRAEVRAFGSRVAGTAKSYSDLELAVVGEQPLSRTVLGELQEEFQESDLPIRVDIVDWHTLDAGFQAVIARQYLVLRRGDEP